jgi:hypothetical protein
VDCELLLTANVFVLRMIERSSNFLHITFTAAYDDSTEFRLQVQRATTDVASSQS